MKWMGPVSSLFDIATYLLMYFVICPAVLGGPYGSPGVNSRQFMILFNTGWFVESLWSQMLAVHMIRTPKIPFIQSRASLPVVLVTSAGILAGTLLPYSPIGPIMGMVPLPGVYFLWLLVIIVLYLTLATLPKNNYVRRYGELL